MAKPIPPSVGTLWNILKHIANFTARAVFGIDTWDKVDRAYDKLVTWFNLLFDYVTDYAAWYGELILDTPYKWLHKLQDWRTAIEDTVDDVLEWFNDLAKGIVAWASGIKDKVTMLCDTLYSFFYGLAQYHVSWVKTWLGKPWTLDLRILE